MKNILKELNLTPTLDNKFILNKKLRYRDIEIPEGFETNGADSPRLFWFIFPPFKPKFLLAVIFHDFLIKEAYKNGLNKKDIIYANDIFKELLIDIEDSFVTRSSILLVKLYWKLRLFYKFIINI